MQSPASAVPSDVDVDVIWGEAFELVLSLVLCTDDEMEVFPETVSRREAFRAHLDATLARRLGPFSEGGIFFSQLLVLAAKTPSPHRVEAMLDDVAAMKPVALLALLLGHGDQVTQLAQALRGSDRERDRLMRDWFPDDERDRRQARPILDQAPRGIKAMLIDVIRRWHTDVFTPEWPALEPILRRDADATAELARTLPLDRFVPAVTKGIDWTAPGGLRHLVFVPTVVLRPWNSMKRYGETAVIAYPVSDASITSADELASTVALRLYKALGDETRLRLLRELAAGDASLAELARALGIAKSTAHHHLVILRDASLVAAGLDDERRYRLRHETLEDTAAPLLAFIRENQR